MKTKMLYFLIVLLGMSASQIRAQEFDLSVFADDIEETMHKLEIKGEEAEKCDEIYKSLNKSLLKLNEEITGKHVKEVDRLIERKFIAANKRFQEVLVKDQFIVVQNLNNQLQKSLTEGLIGTNGLIGTHGLVDEEGMIANKGKRGQLSIVVGTCIK